MVCSRVYIARNRIKILIKISSTSRPNLQPISLKENLIKTQHLLLRIAVRYVTLEYLFEAPPQASLENL